MYVTSCNGIPSQFYIERRAGFKNSKTIVRARLKKDNKGSFQASFYKRVTTLVVRTTLMTLLTAFVQSNRFSKLLRKTGGRSVYALGIHYERVILLTVERIRRYKQT